MPAASVHDGSMIGRISALFAILLALLVWSKPGVAAWRGRQITIPLTPALEGPPMPRVHGPAGRPLVVLDPGHGGHDPGALSPVDGLAEKDLTLVVARRIRDSLLASGRVRVALTREGDRFLVLRERTAIARHLRASLFISIHADSADSTAIGASIYTLSDTASDREAQALATRENKADILNGINLSGRNGAITSILIDLAQRETMATSAAFAALLRREGTGLLPFHAGGLRMAGLAVLKAPDLPAILFELGYLSNPTDLARIRSSAGQAAIAQAVRRAVEIHFAMQPPKD
jgi:N-acetylmuramoyl-L-alanine amidase